jgi:hypothetical protein
LWQAKYLPLKTLETEWYHVFRTIWNVETTGLTIHCRLSRDTNNSMRNRNNAMCNPYDNKYDNSTFAQTRKKRRWNATSVQRQRATGAPEVSQDNLAIDKTMIMTTTIETCNGNGLNDDKEGQKI